LAPDRELSTVALVGTFNAWGQGPALALHRHPDGTWLGTFPRTVLGVPGNSGTTELQFIINGSPDGDVNGNERIGGWVAPEGQRFGNNFVVLWPGMTAATIAQRDVDRHRARADHASLAELTNFRALRGKLAPGRIFRAYHPFLPSRGGTVEQARLRGVQQLFDEHQIAAVINLSDGAQVAESPLAPSAYRDLANQGRVLFTPTSYAVVYFGTADAEFSNVIKRVLAFIAQHPGPYLIHCRLGTDRTGVVSAILQALAGVPWSAIIEDFQLSNLLGIEEYRAPELLTYSITQFLGRSPEAMTAPNLAIAMRARLQQISGALTIAQVLRRLTR
jgi:hypothetical protein